MLRLSNCIVVGVLFGLIGCGGGSNNWHANVSSSSLMAVGSSASDNSSADGGLSSLSSSSQDGISNSDGSKSSIGDSSSSKSSTPNTEMLSGFIIDYPEFLIGDVIQKDVSVVPVDKRQEFSDHMGDIISLAMRTANLKIVHPGKPESSGEVVLFPRIDDPALKAYSDDRALVLSMFFNRDDDCWKPAYGKEANSMLNKENADGTIGTYMKMSYPWNNALGKMTMTMNVGEESIVISLRTVGDISVPQSLFEFESLSVGSVTVHNLEDFAYDEKLGLGLQLVPHPTVDYDTIMDNLCHN